MSLINCTGCGNQISEQADSCPKCSHPVSQSINDSKNKKETNKFLTIFWIFMGFIFIRTVIGALNAESEKIPRKIDTENSSNSSVRIDKEFIPSWEMSTSKDDMTGEKSYYASSPKAKAISRMSFPYSDVESWMAVGCKNSKTWVYFGFSNAPNLNNTETHDGFNTFNSRIKWDNSLETTSFYQKWGEQFLSFNNLDYDAESKIKNHSSVMLDLDWHGQNKAIFRYSLKGSTKALKNVYSKCGKKI
ncbi:hypothetical protein [Bacteriovorax sp. Seq25_V]|uniref:hypothetical protein n=1 Tax=Bacteriovorax sp. Seq25_V TaxID=1201288 RepID=UPI00038A4269|nr:hypothetical protein [Bacteriovorax sp. Seq25_V]EQC47606.1 hypothetical protein M900_0874 [Bacteriovorax sp. Seq25_V]